MARLDSIANAVEASEDSQVSLTDPDARSMLHRGGGIVGYNVQTAVDPPSSDRDLIAQVLIGMATVPVCEMFGLMVYAPGSDTLACGFQSPTSHSGSCASSPWQGSSPPLSPSTSTGRRPGVSRSNSTTPPGGHRRTIARLTEEASFWPDYCSPLPE